MDAERRALAQQVGELLRGVRPLVGGAAETEIVITAAQVAAALQAVDHQIDWRRFRIRLLLPSFISAVISPITEGTSRQPARWSVCGSASGSCGQTPVVGAPIGVRR